jgi:hypothetical protein
VAVFCAVSKIGMSRFNASKCALTDATLMPRVL